MLPVFTFSEIREIEKNIIETEGVPSIVLMENAGKNSFDVINKVIKHLNEKEIYILCGKGNNAGDGFTLARHCLINDTSVNIVMVSDSASLKGDALNNYNLLKKLADVQNDSSGQVNEISYNEFIPESKKFKSSKNVIVIDALLGTGIKGTLDDSIKQVIEHINKLKNSGRIKIISLDVPSGVMSGEQVNPVIEADATVSMGTYKAELLFGEGKDNSGEPHVVPIGITNNLLMKYHSNKRYLVELDDVKRLFPKRRKISHKYANGKVLIIGGSRGLSGSVAMSSLSAVKSGAGGVVAAIPHSVSKVFGRKLHEIMTVELDETEEGAIKNDQFEKLEKRIDWADALLLGPGISTNENTKDFVFEVIKNCSKAMVIDADGLNLLSTDISVLKDRKYTNQVILTPHPGEFSRLTGSGIKDIQLNRFELLKDFCRDNNVNTALKSETTVSCTVNGEMFINSTGNQTLAMAGSGDVLSGIMVSLFAQTKNPQAALICGNYLHGLCSDIYAEKTGNKQSASPQDIIKMIPSAVTYVLS